MKKYIIGHTDTKTFDCDVKMSSYPDHSLALDDLLVYISKHLSDKYNIKNDMSLQDIYLQDKNVIILDKYYSLMRTVSDVDNIKILLHFREKSPGYIYNTYQKIVLKSFFLKPIEEDETQSIIEEIQEPEPEPKQQPKWKNIPNNACKNNQRYESHRGYQKELKEVLRRRKKHM